MHPTTPTEKTVLVTDAGLGSSLAIIRSLGRKGWRVVAADSNPRSLGFRSRYVAERLTYPSPETEAAATVDTLLEAAGRLKVDLIMPVTDAVILPLSAARERFQGVCNVALPTAEALEVATNKELTFELARRLEVPLPRTQLVETVDEALLHGPALGWPLVLKPQVSRLFRESRCIEAYTVCYAQDRDHLARQMARFEGCCPILLQEYTGGVGCGVELLMREGRPLAAFQHRRLREIPINGGASSLRESVPLEPTLLEYSIRLLEELGWTGLAMVEFKIGRNGPKLMEINGRVWGSLPLAVASGMDFPERLARLWLFDETPTGPTPDMDYRVGVRARNLELDLMWMASVLAGRRRFPFLPMPKRRAALAAMLGLFDPRCKFDIMSLKDPGPGVGEVLKIIGKFASKWKESRQAEFPVSDPSSGEGFSRTANFSDHRHAAAKQY